MSGRGLQDVFQIQLSAAQWQALESEADFYGIDLGAVVGLAVEAVAEGLRRPGSWEADAVEAIAARWRVM